MGTDTVNNRSYASVKDAWGAGLAGGLLGGIAMGIILHAGANMMELIGSLYGWPTVLGGWIGHLVNSVILGLIFVLIVSRLKLDEQASSIAEWAFYGAIYATAIGLVTGGIMIPITVNLMGVETIPEPVLPLPGPIGGLLVAFSVGVAHLVYGVLLGTIYGRVHTASRDERSLVD